MSDQLTLSNPKVQRLRRLLGRRSARSEEGVFVVEGAGLVQQAIDAGWEIESLFISGELAAELIDGRPPQPGDRPSAVDFVAGYISSPVFELGKGVLERVATTENPQPVLGVVRARQHSLDVLADASFVVVVDKLADPGNAGTILRSAEAGGADAVVFTQGSVDVFNPKVVRASAGAVFQVPVVSGVSLDEALAVPGLRSWGTTSHQGIRHTDASFSGPTMLVLGNEAHGLADDAGVDDWVTIPHAGRAESLNVAMAATVLIFEVVRQRGQE